MFNWKKPTVEMLGRWQPWHDGHIELFKKALKKTGQVCIMYRDVGGSDAGIDGQADNPFQFEEVKEKIIEGLSKYGYEEGKEYVNKLNSLEEKIKNLETKKSQTETSEVINLAKPK